MLQPDQAAMQTIASVGGPMHSAVFGPVMQAARIQGRRMAARRVLDGLGVVGDRTGRTQGRVRRFGDVDERARPAPFRFRRRPPSRAR